MDYAVLKPDARLEDVTNVPGLSKSWVPPPFAWRVTTSPSSKQITSRVCLVIGFPHGNTSPDIKFAEVRAALEDGAVELDVVIDFGRFLEGREVVVVQELGRIVQLAHKKKALVKDSPPKRATTSQARSSMPAGCALTAAWTS